LNCEQEVIASLIQMRAIITLSLRSFEKVQNKPLICAAFSSLPVLQLHFPLFGDFL
jgi:hypothetical protein